MCLSVGRSKSLVSKQIIGYTFSWCAICFSYRKVTSDVTDSCIFSPLLQGIDPQWHWLAKHNEDIGWRDCVTCHADTMQVCTSQNRWAECLLGGCFCAHPPSEQRPLAVAKHCLCPELMGMVKESSLVLVSEELLMGNKCTEPSTPLRVLLKCCSGGWGAAWEVECRGEKGILGPKSQWLYWLGPFQNHFDFSVGYFLSGYKF